MANLFNHLEKTSAILARDSAEVTAGYAPLPLRNLVVGLPVQFSVFLKIKTKGQISPQFMQCCAAG